MNTRINRDEFLKLTQTRSQAMKSTAVPVEKEKLREQLENDVAEFLASGRKVRELPGTEFKPRPARSTAESGENEYIPEYKIPALVRWANGGPYRKPRRRVLAAITGIPEKRLRQAITSPVKARLTKEEYKRILAAMPEVERTEEGEKQRDAA